MKLEIRITKSYLRDRIKTDFFNNKSEILNRVTDIRNKNYEISFKKTPMGQDAFPISDFLFQITLKANPIN